jgi:hypothetical protein
MHTKTFTKSCDLCIIPILVIQPLICLATCEAVARWKDFNNCYKTCKSLPAQNAFPIWVNWQNWAAADQDRNNMNLNRFRFR